VAGPAQNLHRAESGTACIARSRHQQGSSATRRTAANRYSGIYYEGWTLPDKPARDRTKYSFLSEIQKSFGKVSVPDVDTAAVARGILRLLNKKVSEGEIDEIRAVLPKTLAEFWPEKVRKQTKSGSKTTGKSTRRKAVHTVDELITATELERRAVTGLVRTLRALNEGRAWRVLLGERVRLKGYECTDCAALFAADRENCSYCGSRLQFVENMTNRIVEFTRERGIEVQVVQGAESTAISAKAGGIGAFLKT
jgi:DNA-directed RNA polymerase subunit RPC12/RpoP